jgi:hypothetical protein
VARPRAPRAGCRPGRHAGQPASTGVIKLGERVDRDRHRAHGLRHLPGKPVGTLPEVDGLQAQT